jgi:DNA-binding NtrC family response regulator
MPGTVHFFSKTCISGLCLRRPESLPFASPYGPGGVRPSTLLEETAAENTGENISADDFDFGAIGFKHRVQEIEKKVLRRALKECQFNQCKTAKLLDLSYDQLRGYMRNYDLNK